MEHDNLTFVEAVSEVADSVGMVIPQGVDSEAYIGGGRNTAINNLVNQDKFNINFDIKSLFCVMNSVAKFYEWNLRKNQVAIEYLKQRGISGELAKLYQIGWVPDKWDNLEKFLVGKSIDVLYKNKKLQNHS